MFFVIGKILMLIDFLCCFVEELLLCVVYFLNVVVGIEVVGVGFGLVFGKVEEVVVVLYLIRWFVFVMYVVCLE